MSGEELTHPSIRVECPHCGARPGEVCVMPSGQRYHYGVHQTRRELFISLKTDPRYYAKARVLIQDLGGRMEWEPGGAGGGGAWKAWKIELHGRTHRVPVRGLDSNDLDRLYIPEVDEPRTSLDYGSPGTLQPDAFWRLVDLFKA
jgi:hypothetical protein